MRRISVLFFVVLFGGTALCMAQQQKTAQQQNKWGVFGGYTIERVSGYPNLYTYTDGDAFAPFNLRGGEGSLTYYFRKYIGVTADISITSKGYATNTPMSFQKIREQHYLFGPEFRYTIKTASGSRRVSLFAHQLFGVSHTTIDFEGFPSIECYDNGQTTHATCSANPFTMASGGGMDIRLDSHVSIRPAQLDYLTQQISAKSFLGTGLASQTGSDKLGVSGLRYTVGVVVGF
jgi:hypothetical protein